MREGDIDSEIYWYNIERDSFRIGAEQIEDITPRTSTAIMASGLINGMATILLVIFVDPKVSVVADDVVNQRGSYQTLKKIP